MLLFRVPGRLFAINFGPECCNFGFELLQLICSCIILKLGGGITLSVIKKLVTASMELFGDQLANYGHLGRFLSAMLRNRQGLTSSMPPGVLLQVVERLESLLQLL
eukprot:IDg18339t1